jgi:acetyl esterase/lipase
MRSAIRTTAAIAAFVFALSPANAGAEPQTSEGRKDVALLFHGGGFVLGDPSLMEEAVAEARTAGFKPVAVAYRLWNLQGAIKDAKEAARDHAAPGRDVYAYGESSGGTLAALLAQAELVDAAVAYAPIAKLNRWSGSHRLDSSKRELRQASPALHPTSIRIHSLVPENDDVVSPRHTRRWARRDSLVSAVRVPGEHGFTGQDWYPANLETAVDWLERRAARDQPVRRR